MEGEGGGDIHDEISYVPMFLMIFCMLLQDDEGRMTMESRFLYAVTTS